ncbi:MAG: hypothetical protein Q7T41_01785 [Candidatus Saccharibacteria bacterium]|nr:hypothetical protein [Candidatus Saccharibacteria bacterium]
MPGEIPAPVEAPVPAEVAAVGNFAGKTLLGDTNDFDFSALLDPNFDASKLTVEDAAVRGSGNTWFDKPSLAGAEAANKDDAAKDLGLTPKEYRLARQAGELRPKSGNPGELSTISAKQRAAIVARAA